MAGFQDHCPFIESKHNLNALPNTEPDGGALAYFLRNPNRIRGHIKNVTDGTVKESQKPTYFS